MTPPARTALTAAALFAACGLASATVWTSRPAPVPVSRPVPTWAPAPTRAASLRHAPDVRSVPEVVPLPPLVVRYACLCIQPQKGVTPKEKFDLCGHMNWDIHTLFFTGSDIRLGDNLDAFTLALDRFFPGYDFTVDFTGEVPVTPDGWAFHESRTVTDGTTVSLDESARLQSIERLPSGEIGFNVEEHNHITHRSPTLPGDIGGGGGGGGGDRVVGRTYGVDQTGEGSRVGDWDNRTRTTSPTQYWGDTHMLVECVVPAEQSVRSAHY